MPATPNGPDRRGFVFTVTPLVVAVLIVVAMVAVFVHVAHRSEPIAFGRTMESGTAQPLITRTTPTPTTTTTTPPPPTTTNPDSPALAQQAVTAVNALQVDGVEYGVAILDRETGQETLGAEGAVDFYSASVVKLFVIVDLLHQAEQGAVTLDTAAQADMQSALELSDDDAMDDLWERYDGPTLVTQLIGLAGLQDTVLDSSDPGEWGETAISARDVVAVWQYALTKLDAADTALVMGDTHAAADTGADGFDQAFGLLQPPREPTVKAKQGWMIAGSEMVLNTTGVLGSANQYVVAIMTKQDADIGYAQGRANVNQASQLVEKALAPATT